MTIENERDERGGYKVPYPPRPTVWWKAVFDTKTSTWQAYGRAVFVQADSEPAARGLALDAARADYPGAEITIQRFGQSTPEAASAFAEKKRAYAEWMRKAAKGEPNTRGSL